MFAAARDEPSLQEMEERLAAWLASELEPKITSVSLTRLAGGHSSGAWRVEVTGGPPVGPLVLKAPGQPSPVYRRDAAREGRLMSQLSRLGAPVPAVVAIDDSGAAIGRPCFLMEYVEGRTVEDVAPGGFHADAVLQAAGPEAQRVVWESFHDALAALHCVDPAGVPDASFGPNGITDVLAYWRESLLDEADAASVPRQLALLDWLGDNLPPDADEAPAVCLGDARIVNCLIDDAEARALIDFEVAYVGHPAADIGYSLFISGSQRSGAPSPLPGIPDDEDTWQRWSEATGRSLEHRDYWTAFGAMVLVVTATRAMIQWGMGGAESDNPVVARWEEVVEQAAASSRAPRVPGGR